MFFLARFKDYAIGFELAILSAGNNHFPPIPLCFGPLSMVQQQDADATLKLWDFTKFTSRFNVSSLS